MSTKPESRLQRRIQQALRRDVGGFWFKVWGGPFQAAGLPDLIGCVEGLFFGFEVKTKTGKPSAIQLETLRAIRQDGGAVAKIITEPEEAVEYVKRALQKAGRSSEARRQVVDASVELRPVLRARDRENVDHRRDHRSNVGRKLRRTSRRSSHE